MADRQQQQYLRQAALSQSGDNWLIIKSWIINHHIITEKETVMNLSRKIFSLKIQRKYFNK